MTRSVGLALCLLACGCGGPPPPLVSISQLPDLPAEALKPCPPAETLDGSLGDLAQKDARLAVQYARCSARGDTAVAAYQDAQRSLRDAGARVNAGSGPPAGP